MIDYLMNLGPHITYLILLLGSCIEGESIVLTAGFLSYIGFLKLKWVMLIAFCGTLFADQTLFFIGYRHGPKLLERHPKWREKIEKIFRLLHKYNLWFILGFRFVYGIRTLSPLVIGAARIDKKRFMIMNLIAAIIWTVLSCSAGYILGYFFADRIEQIVHQIGRYQKNFFIGLGILIALGFLIYYFYKKINKKDSK